MSLVPESLWTMFKACHSRIKTMKKWFLGLLVAFIAQVALATQVQMKENAPDVYYVKKGDTLWDISAIYLEQPWLWPKLWRFNPQIDNPHLIYPGDTLSLVYDADGQPMLVMNQKYKKLFYKFHEPVSSAKK